MLEGLSTVPPFVTRNLLLLTDCRIVVTAIMEDDTSIFLENTSLFLAVKNHVPDEPVILTWAARSKVDPAHQLCTFA